ncbi:sugar ABC transporter ATP-binding protein [Hoeflea ulvae]|uniref:Sugar ABC transporter ATP-binding protein n=1 Tax=Hoeflea ulvae TaxID=2983764 RepID=A0ABT3YBM1_9HYPH|nr:sugar ABC transporter ATP-binding protein [Hoeflea ulvae]MCY0093207.1 sugar ABC transporter ATP-binding protein [Hoeflea ulvae]
MGILLEVTGLSKSFPGVRALDNVDFDLVEGEVHALLGENGAGKSTLVKIITGAYRRDEGAMRLNGKPVDFHTPSEAQQAGIGGIYQEFSQVNALTVAENIFLGAYPMRRFGIDWTAINRESARLLEQFGVDANPTDKLSTLGVATRQMIEILKVVHRENLKILIMDEPTSALSDAETRTLFDFVRTLQSMGVSIIYISHRLDEIKQICSRITVFKNGRKVCTSPASDMTIDDIVTQMVGTELKDHFPAKSSHAGDTTLRVSDFCGDGFRNISFTSRQGEVLGITGLVGSGKTELLESIFGARSAASGRLALDDRPISNGSPEEAIANGIGLLPESRKEQGLNLIMSCLGNISLASLDKIAHPFLDLAEETRVAEENFNRLEIRPGDPRNRVVNLSGGNQQKIVLAKWLMRDANILMFDEPTRGIDVGAKFQIYSLIVELARAGKSVIVASSEIDEVIGLCNRALVLRKGEIVKELAGDELNSENVVFSMSGRKHVH